MPIVCAFHHLKIGDKLKNLNMANANGLQTIPTEPCIQCIRLKHVDTLTRKNGFEHGTSKLSMVPFDFRKKKRKTTWTFSRNRRSMITLYGVVPFISYHVAWYALFQEQAFNSSRACWSRLSVVHLTELPCAMIFHGAYRSRTAFFLWLISCSLSPNIHSCHRIVTDLWRNRNSEIHG